MAYSTQDDVEQTVGGSKNLVDMADWDRDGIADPEVITRAIAKADSLINSYASKNFTVPMNPVPDAIRDCSAELAVIFIKKARGQLTVDQERTWEFYAGEKGWLVQLATGVVTPGTDPMPVKHGTMAADTVETTLSCDRDISRGKTSGFW